MLQTADGNIGGSAAIIAELERRRPQPPLYPVDPAARRRATELEAHFDKQLGPHVRRAAFWELIQNREYFGFGRIGGAGFAAGSAMRFSIDEESAARSRAKVRKALDLIEETLAGGDHLVGDGFTVEGHSVEPRIDPPPGTPHIADIILRARRR